MNSNCLMRGGGLAMPDEDRGAAQPLLDHPPRQTQVHHARVLGKPGSQGLGECAHHQGPALPQRLFLMTDPAVLAKFQDGKGRLKKLLNSKMPDESALEELFLATVSRMPTERERQVFAEYKEHGKDRKALLTDTLWALINTREFILNH